MVLQAKLLRPHRIEVALLELVNAAAMAAGEHVARHGRTVLSVARKVWRPRLAPSVEAEFDAVMGAGRR